MIIIRLTSLAGAVIACVALSVGCGGSSGAEGSSGRPYSVEADTTVTTAKEIAPPTYRPRVNKLCREAWAIIVKNFSSYSSTQEASLSRKKRLEEAIQLSLLAGIDFHIFDEIYRLGAPSGMEREVERMIGSMQSAVEQGEKKLIPIETTAQVAHEFADYNRQAHRLGLDDCLVDEAHLNKLHLSRPVYSQLAEPNPK